MENKEKIYTHIWRDDQLRQECVCLECGKVISFSNIEGLSSVCEKFIPPQPSIIKSFWNNFYNILDFDGLVENENGDLESPSKIIKRKIQQAEAQIRKEIGEKIEKEGRERPLWINELEQGTIKVIEVEKALQIINSEAKPR